jgi:hypothetical protein
MTNEQESHLGMYLPVNVYSVANATITKGLPIFDQNLVILQATILQIQSVAEQQKLDKTGATTGKNNLGLSLASIAADNSRKLWTYGKFTNNPTLQSEVNISESKFKNFSDTDLKDYAQIVYNLAQTNLAALPTYGITAATQTAFLAAINNYNASLATPRVNATAKSQATKQLVVLFKTANEALANMDAAVEIVRLTQPNFYNGYRTARKVIYNGTSSLALKVTTINAVTGEPEANVEITFTPVASLSKAASTNGNDKIVKKTAAGGGANVKNMADGDYEYTTKKSGCKSSKGIVSVVNGETTFLEIKIEKS